MDTRDEMRGRNVRVQVVYQKEDVVAVRHNRRREVSPYWLAILFEDVQAKANGGHFVRDKVPLGWLNQTEDTLTYTSGDVCDQNSPKCILARVLDFTCEKSGNVLTVNVSPEEDIRLSRIANGNVGEEEDDSENENEAEMPNHDDHHDRRVTSTKVGGYKLIWAKNNAFRFRLSPIIYDHFTLKICKPGFNS